MQHARVIFSAGQAAAALWTYGEDTLVDAALRLSRGELEVVWSIAASAYELSPAAVPHPRPLALDAVSALACVRHVEGRWRPLSRQRRRPRTAMPAHLSDAQPVPMDWVTDHWITG